MTRNNGRCADSIEVILSKHPLTRIYISYSNCIALSWASDFKTLRINSKPGKMWQAVLFSTSQAHHPLAQEDNRCFLVLTPWPYGTARLEANSFFDLPQAQA